MSQVNRKTAKPIKSNQNRTNLTDLRFYNMPIELQIIKYIIKKNIRFSVLYIEEMRNVSK
jgi:hypothetical protein